MVFWGISVIQIWIILIDKNLKLPYHVVMKDDFNIHNLFQKSLEEFDKFDPHLSRLINVPYIFHSLLETEIPMTTSGIYILTGSRQVGKSTLVKFIIRRLIAEKILPPENVYYLPCDTITDFGQLLFEIEQFLQSIGRSQKFALFIDEVTYVREWDRAIKSLADSGMLNKGSVLITGFDSHILKEAMMRFPGRRGLADVQDFHLHPLSFFELVGLKDNSLATKFENPRRNFSTEFQIADLSLDGNAEKKLSDHFNEYLITGGYMPAVNAWEGGKQIPSAIYRTYVQWIVGDILKRGKQERYLREIVSAIIPRLTKQISWHNLASEMSIDHHKTVADYIDLLCRMDVAVVLMALREDKLKASPKKAKKICINDPFIFHSLRGWVKNEADGFKLSMELVVGKSDLKNALIESVLASIFNRSSETFYIKAEGEVDIALVKGKIFFPIEIKNSPTLNKGTLKQILKYNNGIIAYAGSEIGKFENLDVIPIPVLAMLA